MKLRHVLAFATVLIVVSLICSAQGNSPKVEDATTGVVRAFETHNIVMFGEEHGNKQEYEWLRSLVATPEFADRVDDIVMEFGNSLYQKSVDRYVNGEDIPIEQVQKAWRNLAGALGPPSPVYASLYQAVRATNLKRRGKHQMRIVCGDPYIDWEKVRDREDIGPFVANRDQWYTQVVKDEVLAKHHRTLLIMGAYHFERSADDPGDIEKELRTAGATTFVILFGTNAVGGYDDLDKRFDTLRVPALIPLKGTWAGDLLADAVLSGGTAPPDSSGLKLQGAADALLYLGPRDSLTQVSMLRAELDGTPYGKEIERRLTIELGHVPNFISEKEESPQFSRPQPHGSGSPPPPKSIHDPLPPRPVSQ